MEAELSKREKEVVKAIAYGASVEECAEELFIAKRTVTNHLQNIYDKTGARSLNAISAWYFCREFNISFRFSTTRKKLIITALVAIIVPASIVDGKLLTTRFMRNKSRQTYQTAAV